MRSRTWGFKGVIDTIDPAPVAETAEKVANAFSGAKLISADKIIITYETAQSEN
jgi:hypothetical protein